MKRLTTTFQGMEFIKILLEALGWNAFSPRKTELQHQSPVAELTGSSETSGCGGVPARAPALPFFPQGRLQRQHPAGERTLPTDPMTRARVEAQCPHLRQKPTRSLARHQWRLPPCLLLACRATEPWLQGAKPPPLGSRGYPNCRGTYMWWGGPATRPSRASPRGVSYFPEHQLDSRIW